MLAITNVVGSTLARYADDILYTRAGPEISVASTKAYMAMLIAQYLLALRLGSARGTVNEELAASVSHGLHQLPGAIEEVLKHEDATIEAAKLMVDADDVYFIGRGLDYAIAMEGSLKLKEISYLHSEAMPAGELKHGTLALITDDVPVVVVLTQRAVYEKTISAVQEVKATGRQDHRCCVRHRHGDRQVRRLRAQDPGHGGSPGPGSGGRAPPTDGLPRRTHARPRHRPTEEPRQERHSRIAHDAAIRHTGRST